METQTRNPQQEPQKDIKREAQANETEPSQAIAYPKNKVSQALQDYEPTQEEKSINKRFLEPTLFLVSLF